jgi:hypothetical protein
VHEQISQGEIPQGQNFLQPPFQVDPRYAHLKSASIHGDRTATRLAASPPTPLFKHILPGFLRPLPQRMTSANIDYLFAKGAFSLPDIPVRNALLRSYPYMPVVEIQELMEIMKGGTRASGRISLLLDERGLLESEDCEEGVLPESEDECFPHAVKLFVANFNRFCTTSTMSSFVFPSFNLSSC